jgi:hypothetical protein
MKSLPVILSVMLFMVLSLAGIPSAPETTILVRTPVGPAPPVIPRIVGIPDGLALGISSGRGELKSLVN